MTSMPSDSESNVSGFIRYSNKNFKHLYMSMIESMSLINQDLLEIEKNLTSITKQAGPLECQMNALLQHLPKQNLPMQISEEMQTD